MTLSDAILLVREYLLETKAAQFDDTTISKLINEANYQVWSEVVSFLDDRLVKDYVLAYAANEQSVDLSDVPPEGTPVGSSIAPWMFITSITTSNTGTITATNPPETLEPAANFESLFDVASYEKDKYYLAGTKIYIWPIPTTTTYMHIQLIPGIAEVASATDNLLNGVRQLYMFHELVVLLATIRARTMTEDPTEGFAQIYKLRRQSMQDCLKASQQRHSSMRIINQHR